MGSQWSARENELRKNFQNEMRTQREQHERENQRYQQEIKQRQDELRQNEQRHKEEMNQRQQQFQQAEQRHLQEIKQTQQELTTSNLGIGLEQKLNRKRMKLLNKMPGQSTHFPKGVRAPSRLIISLFGETATGKTSLINSLKFAIEGKLKNLQAVQTANTNYQGAHTLESVEVVLTKYLSVIDNRGINFEEAAKKTKQEIVTRQMEGIYQRNTVTWQSLPPGHGNTEDKKSYCSVLVFSAQNANTARQYRSFIHHLRTWQGRFPLAVITHVDEASSEDVRLALQSGGIGDIYEVSNITSGNNDRNTVSREHQLQLLELLEKSLLDGDSIFLRRKEIEKNGE